MRLSDTEIREIAVTIRGLRYTGGIDFEDTLVEFGKKIAAAQLAALSSGDGLLTEDNLLTCWETPHPAFIAESAHILFHLNCAAKAQLLKCNLTRQAEIEKAVQDAYKKAARAVTRQVDEARKEEHNRMQGQIDALKQEQP